LSIAVQTAIFTSNIASISSVLSARSAEAFNINWNFATDFYTVMNLTKTEIQHPFFMEVFSIATSFQGWKIFLASL
jgi:hypothetical protein